jgi:hypothetical protein
MIPHLKIDLMAMINHVRSYHEAESIERYILDRTDQLARVLLPMYIVYDYLNNSHGLASGHSNRVAAQLGVPVKLPAYRSKESFEILLSAMLQYRQLCGRGSCARKQRARRSFIGRAIISLRSMFRCPEECAPGHQRTGRRRPSERHPLLQILPHPLGAASRCMGAVFHLFTE